MTNPAQTQRRPGRPPSISREKIVEAVSSAENLDTLTMRELAARLGVRHGALYRWVKNRDELFDLLSDVLVERIVAAADSAEPPDRLARMAWAMHDQFLALPGYATHLARPHRHNAHSTDRLRRAIVTIFLDADADADLAEQSWHIFITCIVSWLAASENPHDVGPDSPSADRFAIFLGVLLRGLPARHPGTPQL